MNRVALSHLFVLALLFVGVAVATPPPAGETIVITAQPDRDSVEEHELVIDQLAKLAANKRHWQAKQSAAASRVATIDSAISTLGGKVRRWLVRRRPALGGTLPASLEDAHYEKDTDAGASDTLRFNSAAAARRALPN